MTVEAYPGLLQNRTYPAEQVRRTISSLLQRGTTIGSVVGGIVGAGDCKIVPVSGRKVQVEPGEVWVPGSESSTQGGYYCRVSAAEVLEAATPGANPRCDRVVLKVNDETYKKEASKNNEGFLEIVKGAVENAGMTLNNCESYAPAAPANSYTLGFLVVKSGPTVEIDNVASIIGGTPPFHWTKAVASLTAVPGEYIQMYSTGQTVTLPAIPTAGALVGVYSNPGCTTKIKGTATYFIYGDFITGKEEITLLANQHVLLCGTGNSWTIVAGEPAWEPTFFSLPGNAEKTNYVLSTSRPTEVHLEVEAPVGSEGNVQVKYPGGGGYTVAKWKSAGNASTIIPVKFMLPANYYWFWEVTGSATVSGGYLVH